jgi:hypothetical protein
VDTNFGGFLKVLPKIADHPLAIVAYISLVAVWLVWFYRRRKSKDFLKALELIPELQRAQFCQNAGYKYDELAHLPPKDRLKRLTKRDILIVRLVIVIAATLLVIASLREIHQMSGVPPQPPSQTVENNGRIGAPVQNAIGSSNVQTINR